mmetsp:Transcript_56389/g.114897  ORF Transcript_56389/g.114897 Transcript_56389/m.114897 type:complete len:517 (+) Transcript_56389:1025-2575(+)
MFVFLILLLLVLLLLLVRLRGLGDSTALAHAAAGAGHHDIRCVVVAATRSAIARRGSGIALACTGAARHVDTRAALQLAHAGLHLGAALDGDGGLRGLAESVDAHRERGLGREDARDLALVLGVGLAHEAGVVQQAVLGRLVLGFEGTEQRLLGAEDLDGASGLLRKVEQAAGVRDETGANELAHHHGQVRRDGVHAVLEVLEQLGAVLGQVDHLVGQLVDVQQVHLADVRAHGDDCSLLEAGFDLLRQNVRQVRGGTGMAHAHLHDHLRVLQVVVDDLGHLREVPAVPLLHTHRVGVDLLVELVQQADGLHDHRVNLVRAELQLIAGQGVAQAQHHSAKLVLLQAVDEGRKLATDAAHQLHDARVAHALHAKLLLDDAAHLGVHDREGVGEALLHDVGLDELLQALAELALHQRGGCRQSLGGVPKAGECLQGHGLTRLLGRLEALRELGHILKLVVVDAEQAEARRRFKQDEHGYGVGVWWHKVLRLRRGSTDKPTALAPRSTKVCVGCRNLHG